jgi:hypothetical protein
MENSVDGPVEKERTKKLPRELRIKLRVPRGFFTLLEMFTR